MEEETKIFYEQYRDAANPELTGFILRWHTDGSVVNVYVYEATGSRLELDADGWRTGLHLDGGDEEMISALRHPAIPEHEFDYLPPDFHLYMKYDGTMHVWSNHYMLKAGDAAYLMLVTDMLRYVAARMAVMQQERLTAQGKTYCEIFPLRYNSPTIEVRPFTPEPL